MEERGKRSRREEELVPDRGELLGHHDKFGYIPHVIGQHRRDPLATMQRRDLQGCVHTPAPKWICVLTCKPFCTLTRQVLIQGKLGHVSWSSHQRPLKKAPSEGEGGVRLCPSAVAPGSTWILSK